MSLKMFARVAGFGALLCYALAVSAQQPNAAKEPGHSAQNQSFAQEELELKSALPATEAELRSKIKQRPNSPELLYQLGLVLRLERKIGESLSVYTQAASLQRPDAAQLRSVAFDYVQLNDYEDAIHWLRVALGMDPSSIDVLYSLGRCFYTQNKFPQAEAAFERVLQLKPDHLKAEENLGLTYDGENKPQLAEKALRAAADWAQQRNLPDLWPYLDLGTFLLDQSRGAEALPFLKKAALLGPASAPAHQILGRALLSTGKAQDAVTQLELATKLDPKNPKTHFELGRAYREAGQPEKARSEFAISRSLYGSHNQD